MRRVDAPAPGWYPDPRHRSRLRWWDGLDWTDIQRAPPSTAELNAAEHEHAEALALAAATQHIPPAPQSGLTRQDAQEIITEVRSVARQEIDRAADEFSQRAATAVRSVSPLISEYTSQLTRWVRRAVIISIVLLAGYFIFQVIAQASFFDWLGDRIDNIEFDSGMEASRLGSDPHRDVTEWV